MGELLRLSGAEVRFLVPGGVVRALDGVDLSVGRGESVAVVGESGCGKTTLARVVLGLQSLSGGEAVLDGIRVGAPRRGQAGHVGMVWQDPFASIQPLWTVRRILEEPFRLVGRRPEVERLMEEVGLDSKLAGRYPHELSGGQRQRAAIARAIALDPPLVICDEPTAALDLSIQAQILNLLKDLQARTGCAYLYISHDLQTVRYVSGRVVVMYMGRVVESGPTESVFEAPMHPYTRALLDSAPSLERLGVLPAAARGEVPDPKMLGVGCGFAGRCPRAAEVCLAGRPAWSESGSEGRLSSGRSGSHGALCLFPDNLS